MSGAGGQRRRGRFHATGRDEAFARGARYGRCAWSHRILDKVVHWQVGSCGTMRRCVQILGWQNPLLDAFRDDTFSAFGGTRGLLLRK